MAGGVRWTEAELKAHEQRLVAGDAGRVVTPRPLPVERGYRSKTEASFAQWLDIQKMAGQIGGWQYEEVRLRLAAGKTYVPDFLVLCVGFVGNFSHFAEVKGRKGAGFYSRDLGKLKIAMAARLFPWWDFRVYWPGDRGEWECWEVPKR